jgi:hypothetical protein
VKNIMEDEEERLLKTLLERSDFKFRVSFEG